MEKDILTRTVELQTLFGLETGRKAGAVFMGRQEWRELEEFANRHQYTDERLIPEQCEGGNRIEFGGLKVYAVNADQFLQVAE